MSKFSDAARAPFYFAYGSNMDVAQMQSRVPGATVLGTGFLSGHAFTFSGYSERWSGAVANVVKKARSRVFGVVYELPPFGLAKLDRFEGYPHAYQRKTATITLTQGGKVGVVLYYKRDPRPLSPPNPRYVTLILAALRRHGAP